MKFIDQMGPNFLNIKQGQIEDLLLVTRGFIPQFF